MAQQNPMALNIIILAAGEGSRMRSAIPKVLHKLGGIPLLGHVLQTSHSLSAERVVVVYGHGGEQVRAALNEPDVVWVEQAEQLGTGHAVLQGIPYLAKDDTVLILYGDVPLTSAHTLQRLVSRVDDNSLALLTADLEDPSGYGRIVRDERRQVTRIVEDKDASDEQRSISEINTGILAVKAALLGECLSAIKNDNAQGEYYLTDIIAMAVEKGVSIVTESPDSIDEIIGVNNRVQLAALERSFQQTQAERLMMSGVTLYDPARFDLRGRLQAGSDVVIDVNVVLEGEVVLGDRVQIGANVIIKDASIGDDVVIRSNCVIEGAVIGHSCQLGPFARVRPETVCREEVRIGNFVEVKKSTIGSGSKINHLSYVGDSTVGREVNIGAGTITCNYDGANKHQTDIGDNVFIGSNTQIIAPVKIGAGATIGAGSTITRDVPGDELTLSRAPQETLKGWVRPAKK